MPKTIVTKRFRLSAMHSLGNPDLTPDQNREIFGPCFRLHGHDYKIDVSVTGSEESTGGLTVDRDALDHAVNETIIKPFNGTNLNNAFANTSGEALSLEFHELILEALPDGIRLEKVTLVETLRNTFVAE
ncbi:MAG: 6-carboxytetrahydropterin synthase [Bdellovibrionia bacterium]